MQDVDAHQLGSNGRLWWMFPCHPSISTSIQFHVTSTYFLLIVVNHVSSWGELQSCPTLCHPSADCNSPSSNMLHWLSSGCKSDKICLCIDLYVSCGRAQPVFVTNLGFFFPFFHLQKIDVYVIKCFRFFWVFKHWPRAVVWNAMQLKNMVSWLANIQKLLCEHPPAAIW
jgi:hypothetical protein